MSGGIRSVFLLTMAAGVISGCGGDRVTTSMAPEADPLAEGVNPAARQGYAGQPLGKLAINGNMTQAVVVAIVKQGGAPLGGVTVELSRSVSGLPTDFAWSGATDANGEARVEIGGGNVKRLLSGARRSGWGRAGFLVEHSGQWRIRSDC